MQMRPIGLGDWWRILWAVLIALAIIAINTALLRAEPVEVRAASGRTFSGEVDPRSNNERLWLRSERGDSAVYRPIDWSCIESVTHGDKKLSATEAQAQLAKLQSARKVVEAKPAESLPAPRGNAEIIPTAAVQKVAAPHLVRSLQVDAQLGHWGQYANSDGVMLVIAPTDERGFLVAATGTLEVELLGEMPDRFPNGREFLRLGRWVEAVSVLDYGPTGAVIRLPFQAVHPEFNQAIGPKAIVHARFSVAGSGTFDASTPAVRVRAYNPIRDRLEQREGNRFFAEEWTSRGDR